MSNSPKKVHPSIMEEIIYKYLNNTISKAEGEQLKDWLETSEENKAILSQLASFYKNSDSDLSLMKDTIWNEISSNLENDSSQTNNRSSWLLLKIAATLVLVSSIVLSIYHLNSSSIRNQTIVADLVYKTAPTGNRVITQLPDGSKVFLNAGSEISYDREFTGSTRNVTLSGEAFFEVKHDSKKPFLVQMNGDFVKVLGTSFNIRSYAEDNAVYVSVATGKVSYTIPSGDEVILEPNRMAKYIPGKGSLTTGKVDELVFGWRNKVLYLNDLTLNQIIVELERWYGVEIEYDKSVRFRGTYTEHFDNPTLREVLNSLSFVYRFNFDINDSKVTLNEITN